MTAGEMANNITATGGVYAALLPAVRELESVTSVEVVCDERGMPTNQLLVTLSFMSSPYLLTVERKPS